MLTGPCSCLPHHSLKCSRRPHSTLHYPFPIRFVSTLSPQTVAPIRETTAQALGAVLRSAPPRLVASTLSVLAVLRSRPEWQVRHGALLSLKYLVAVRPGMIPGLLAPQLLPAALAGLRDRDDDVIAASADALLPAAGAIAGGAGDAVPRLLRALWDALLNLDDLSPSIGSVMRLLAELYAQQGVAAAGEGLGVGGFMVSSLRAWSLSSAELLAGSGGCKHRLVCSGSKVALEGFALGAFALSFSVEGKEGVRSRSSTCWVPCFSNWKMKTTRATGEALLGQWQLPLSDN